MAIRRTSPLTAALLAFLCLLPLACSQEQGTTYFAYQDENGERILLADNRRPSLYTDNYGSCLDSGLIDVSRFDAAFYRDNMTVIFDIHGTTNLTNEALMIYIGVFAYGESRFELPFNPCDANIESMCPVMSNVSISANGQIPLAQSDIAVIPSIAYTIPDFEGQAILRIFANSTQSEIACYSAVVTNGATFSHPSAIASILGVFAFVAVVASFITAIYGSDIASTRTHYAHSLSVLVVFSVYQHIFFTGALSMNWPSVLPAFWSNYAWSAGIINTKSMQDSFDRLTRNDRGNTSMLGAAGTDTWASNVGGGFDIQQIYKRTLDVNSHTLVKRFEHMLAKRQSTGNDNLTTTKFMGHLVRAGLPLPGNYSGFPGTLYVEQISASNAFLTGLVWFLIMILIVGGGVVLFKFGLEGLYKMRVMKTERLNYFRTHYLGFLAAAILRTCFIGFFAMMFFTLFQFSYGGAASVLGIAGVVFAIFFIGIFGMVGYACYYKLRFDTWASIRSRYEPGFVFGFLPCLRRVDLTVQVVPGGADAAPKDKDKALAVDEAAAASADKLSATPTSTWQLNQIVESQRSVHDDEDFTKKFGWLASRHRKSKWWFFAAWAAYEFVRACFFAGASGHAMVQVFGLLVVEFIAFLTIVSMRPFEGQRLNIIMVYLLGFSKVATVALSAAFDVSFNLGRIITTVIGIVIIVIQGILTIVLMICIVLSAVTSYFSVMRYREEIRPKGWNSFRERYFKHLHRAVRDRPPTPPPVLPTPPPEEPKGPYFSVNSVKRAPKIEDEDVEFLAEIARDPRLSGDWFRPETSVENTDSNFYNNTAASGSRVSRAMSASSSRRSTYLPYAARIHRGSWSTREFSEFNEGLEEADETTRTTLPGVNEDVRPASRQNLVLNTRVSHDSMGRPPAAGAAALSRSASAAQLAEENNRSNPVSPLEPRATASPTLSQAESLRAATPTAGSANHSRDVSDSTSRPVSPVVNTPIARTVDSTSPPPSPRSPGRPRSRLQKRRQGESPIDESNEG